MITLGIDLGSNTVKAVLVSEGRQILAFHLARTTYDFDAVASACVEACLEEADIELQQCDTIVATGYGRISCSFAKKNISEISCHARGAWFHNPDARTVIDIGGQDSKVIALAGNGTMVDFVMNDKCAAGTGRFLEVMASALGVSLTDFSLLARRASNPLPISNTCTVFAESEVIGLVARKMPREDIIAGLHESIASRVCALANRVRIDDPIVFSGGVALNEGVRDALEFALERKLHVLPTPQITGALGAALLGADGCKSGKA